MIEVEHKFRFQEEGVKRLIDGAEFLGEKTLTDVYYDTKDFKLTLHDIWLRTRDGKFELKLPLERSSNSFMNNYREVENDNDIRKELGISGRGTLDADLRKSGYLPFVSLTTRRKKYKKQGFGIDIDEVEGPEYRYALIEIEKMVSGPEEMPHAEEEIISFAKNQGLTVAVVNGKVLEYIRQKIPNLYRELGTVYTLEK